MALFVQMAACEARGRASAGIAMWGKLPKERITRIEIRSCSALERVKLERRDCGAVRRCREVRLLIYWSRLM